MPSSFFFNLLSSEYISLLFLGSNNQSLIDGTGFLITSAESRMARGQEREVGRVEQAAPSAALSWGGQKLERALSPSWGLRARFGGEVETEHPPGAAAGWR